MCDAAHPCHQVSVVDTVLSHLPTSLHLDATCSEYGDMVDRLRRAAEAHKVSAKKERAKHARIIEDLDKRVRVPPLPPSPLACFCCVLLPCVRFGGMCMLAVNRCVTCRAMLDVCVDPFSYIPVRRTMKRDISLTRTC